MALAPTMKVSACRYAGLLGCFALLSVGCTDGLATSNGTEGVDSALKVRHKPGRRGDDHRDHHDHGRGCHTGGADGHDAGAQGGAGGAGGGTTDAGGVGGSGGLGGEGGAPDAGAADARDGGTDTVGSEDAQALSCRWTGDFDGDGIADCAVLIPHDSANGDIAFHRGLGGGAYAASTVVTAGIQSPSGSDFAVFDLNHDGRQDIITMPITTAPAGTSGFRVNVFFQIFRGQADGTFVPLATTPPDPGLNFPLLINDGANLSPAPAFAGFETDLDGDGFPDLLSTESYFPSIREWVVVKSSGGLDFQVKRSFAPSIEGSVSPQVVTDLDDDNKKDIVSITTRLTVRIPPATVAGAAWVSLGVGDGTFSNTKVDGSEDALKVVVRDLNMDGRLDLLVTFPPQRSPWVTPPYTCVVGMGVFYATDSGFKPPFATTVSGLDVFDPAFHGLINLCGGHVSLFVSPGPSQVIPGTDNALDVTVRDVNADQHQDLNITFPDGIKTFFGDGTGHFAP